MLQRFIAAALLTTPLTTTTAGTDPPAGGKAPPPPMTASSGQDGPLSFFGGRLRFDFHERLRFEWRENNFDFDDATDALTDDAWALNRLRLGATWQPVPWFTLHAQGQDTREFGSDRPDVIGQLGAEGDDRFDLRQAWVQLGADRGPSVKLGRQVLQYGDQRLVGPGDWSNQSRLFDAAKFRYAAEDWALDVFTASVVRFRDGRFNRSDWLDPDDARDQFFSGAYFTTAAVPAHTVDLYTLQLHEKGGTDVWTVGSRWAGDPRKLGGFEWDANVAGQFGEVRGLELRAFAAHAGAGWHWLDAPWQPRLFAEYNFASGDDDPADASVGTFQNLFPSNHGFYGFMDRFSWQNVHNPALSLSAKPTPDLTVRLDVLAFWLADTNDAWYRSNGTARVRPVTPGADRFAGTELDLSLAWKARKWLTFQAGWSHFFAGDHLEASGASDDADFAWVMTTVDL